MALRSHRSAHRSGRDHADGGVLFRKGDAMTDVRIELIRNSGGFRISWGSEGDYFDYLAALGMLDLARIDLLKKIRTSKKKNEEKP
jgi:hypothetical protein